MYLYIYCYGSTGSDNSINILINHSRIAIGLACYSGGYEQKFEENNNYF